MKSRFLSTACAGCGVVFSSGLVGFAAAGTPQESLSGNAEYPGAFAEVF